MPIIPRLCWALERLANVVSARGNFKEAAGLLSEAHLQVADGGGSLVKVLISEEKWAEAEKILKILLDNTPESGSGTRHEGHEGHEVDSTRLVRLGYQVGGATQSCKTWPLDRACARA